MLAIIGGINNYSPVPFWDMWDGYLNFYVKASQGDLLIWWAQHNDHRILIAKLFYFLDIFLFRGQSWFLIILNYILLCSICILFCRLCNEDKFKDRDWACYFLIAWLFSWAQKENLAWAFESPFFLAQLIPLLAFYFMYSHIKVGANKNSRFFISVFLGFLAIGTMANGVFALPLLGIFSLLSGLNWKKIFFILFVSTISFFLYFKNYDQKHDLLAPLIKDPAAYIHYVLLYLGAPFFELFGAGDFGHLVSVCAGSLILVCFLFFAFKVFVTKKREPFFLMLLIFIFYIILTAVISASGRINNGGGVFQALSSRYLTPQLMIWGALFLIYLPKIELHNKSALYRFKVLLFFILLLMVPIQIKAIRSMSALNFEKDIAALALEIGVEDQMQILNVYPSAKRALELSEIPRLQNLSIFGVKYIRDLRESIGKQLGNTNSNNNKECTGKVDAVNFVKEDTRFIKITGHIVANNLNKFTLKPTPYILNSSNLVIGRVILNKTLLNSFNTSIFVFKGYVRKENLSNANVFLDPETGCSFSFLKIT